MTNIKILKDRIIFDGHADTRQECETITLMCDNLAQSKDFKTVRYESGYAEFEKIGATDGLMFAAANANIIIYFDSHITLVTGGGCTWSTSGQGPDEGMGPPGSYYTFTATLAAGYILDTVVITGNSEASVSNIIENTFDYSGPGSDSSDVIITITSKLPLAKQTIDVSTLSGWEGLASGNHQITVKTKASGYKDSAASNAVTVSKAAVGYKLTVSFVGDFAESSGNAGYANIVYADGTTTKYVKAGTYNNVATVSYVNANVGDYVLKDSSGATHSRTPYNLTSDTTLAINWMPCLIEGTQITLADGSTKAIEDITYDDELLVWNFYEGRFDTAKPTWIKVAQTTPKYNLVKFSNGAEVGFVGPGEHTRKSDGGRGYHRIFNNEAGAFTYVGTEETPIGTTTFADDNSFPTVVSEEIIEKEVKFYNVITDKHFNIFANGILTSCRLSNMYRIENMKYVGERLITDEQVKAYFEERKAITKPRLTTDR